MNRHNVFHARMSDVPEGVGAHELPTIHDFITSHPTASSFTVTKLSVEIPANADERTVELACRGLLWESELSGLDSLTFINKDR